MNPRINEAITSDSILLIDENGDSRGIVSRDQALYLAYEKETDLIEISPNAQPPVAKLLDFGKFQYEQQKKLSKQKSNQKGGEIKEVRLSLKIDNHDFETKGRKAKGFLQDGDKVRTTVVLKGRENMFPDRAIDVLNRFAEFVGGKIDQPASRLGNRISITINKS